MHPLARVVAQLPQPAILVVGDLILDRYIEGDAQRVSPEAPVLVFESKGHRYRPGGACNVAANLAELGAKASVLGTVGEDNAAQQLKDLLAAAGIGMAGLVPDKSRPTTRKTRYVNRTAQVLRVDQEDCSPVDGGCQQRIVELLGERPFPYQAVLISDYGKGVVTKPVVEAAIAAAHSAGGIVVVDPKGVDYSIYRGVDLLTPNREEAMAATGIQVEVNEDLHKVATKLKEITGIRSATVTLGKDGIFYELEDGNSRTIPTDARAVFDVTGAGDTVVAALTMARACGVGMHDSVRLANLAAGIVVAHFGTYAVSRGELLSLLGEREPGKILDRETAVAVSTKLRAQGRRVVFTNGCFDILHPGHTDYLERARAYGDVLFVGINTDASVQSLDKGEGRPINTLADRMDVLSALKAVDYIVPFDDDSPLELVKAITPHMLVKGEDWRDRGVVGRDWVEAHGGQVVLVPLREGCSTTALIERIRGGQSAPK
jgi:D-beta-D-heptose 7-phosphate kinase/D-beta-D-heptose 1-phosphate adenosyltransferase